MGKLLLLSFMLFVVGCNTPQDYTTTEYEASPTVENNTAQAVTVNFCSDEDSDRPALTLNSGQTNSYTAPTGVVTKHQCPESSASVGGVDLGSILLDQESSTECRDEYPAQTYKYISYPSLSTADAANYKFCQTSEDSSNSSTLNLPAFYLININDSCPAHSSYYDPSIANPC